MGNAYIIEVRVRGPGETARPVAQRWIGIAASAQAMIDQLPGEQPSVVDRGPAVLALAHMLGLRSGEVRELENQVPPPRRG